MAGTATTSTAAPCTVPLAEAAEAFRLSREGHVAGRITIRVSSPG